MDNNKEIIIVDERSLRDKIYMIRGQQVMLDFDLAEIYGYSTSAFNQQVSRNIDRFDDDFMFQLTKDEYQILISQNVISSWGGRRKMPNAFTEQGIYMLMTVLKGELAIRQSKTLIRLFKSMKDYIIENQQLMITQKDYYALAEKVNNNSADIKEIKENMVTKTDLSDFMKLFDSGIEHDEILILDGEPFKADLAYQKIYRFAKKGIVVIDDYISIKTLQHLLHSKTSVKLTIISDNKARPPLRQTEYVDFQKENPGRSIAFITTAHKAHDRYIILDYGTKDMRVYHCGASSKDAGKKITTITQVRDLSGYSDMVKELLANPTLTLK
ncbi:MAG: ORF6N domain-containing protein [Eubacterium sp.]|nr:ORF6N domain-containing protein [Eubacterium sp.]